MSTSVKEMDGSMTIGWQETANEIIKSLFLENNDAVVR